MNELGDELGAAIEASRAGHADARAPHSVRSRIARRRGIRVGLLAGAAALGVGVLATASITAVLDSDPAAAPAPTSSPDLSLTEGETAYATVSFDEAPLMRGAFGGYELSLEESLQQCGQPLPTPLASDDDFDVSFAPVRSLIDASATTTVTYKGHEFTPMVLASTQTLVAQDGVIVAIQVAFEEPSLSRLDPGGTRRVAWFGSPYYYLCETGEEGFIEPGEYEVALVQRIFASEAVNAQLDLAPSGFGIPHTSQLNAYREGSWECAQYQFEGSVVPVTCDPDGLAGATVDLEEGTVTFPYRADAYTRDIDSEFVSEPTSIALSQDDLNDLGIYYPDPAASNGFDEFACGATGNYQYWGTDFLSGNINHLPEPGDTLSGRAWRYDTTDWSWESFDIHMPDTVRVWLLGFDPEEYERAEGSGSVQISEHVIGWFDMNPPTEIHVDRYVGPTRWEAQVVDSGTCGPDPIESVQITVVLVETATVSDGSKEPVTAVLPIFDFYL